MNWRPFLYNISAFASGGAIVIVVAFLRASIIHAEETDRHEQTMAPGIMMFSGMLLAPVGGAIGMVVMRLVRKRRKNQHGRKEIREIDNRDA
jgi:hypothetical protein